MLHAFIDTNVYLTFFSFTAEDLEELRKLHVAIRNGDLRLWTTEQVRDEFRRNRESRVSESIRTLRDMRPSDRMPHMARNLPESQPFLDARREFGRQLNAVEERLSREFAEESLAADAVLRELMEKAEEIAVTHELLQAARRRVDVGNPPGKKGSLGDAINWECLLSVCPSGEDLYFVTDDADFVSKMSNDRISAFLGNEWRDTKGGEIHLHRRISDFLRDKFPDIELATEFEKELRIQRLVNSHSFDETHRAISRLSGYTEFSDQQVRDLREAALNNSQIRWIAYDPDVQKFFQELVAAHRDRIDDEELELFHQYFDEDDAAPEPSDDDIPF